MSSICLPPGANDQLVKVCLTTLIPGYFFSACMKPVWRSVSAGTPAMPRISTTLPFPPIFLNSHWAPRRPYATWSFVTLCACGAVTRWSTDTTLMPREAACEMTELSAVALDGLMMMAFAPAEIRLRMSAVCSAGPPLRFATTTLLTTPLASACALTAQIISSRQPLPTSVLDTPSTYFACGLFGFADAVTAAVTAIATRTRTAKTQRTLIGTLMHPPSYRSTALRQYLSRHFAHPKRRYPGACSSVNPGR